MVFLLVLTASQNHKNKRVINNQTINWLGCACFCRCGSLLPELQQMSLTCFVCLFVLRCQSQLLCHPEPQIRCER